MWLLDTKNVGLKNGISFTLFQLEIISQNFNEKSKQKQPKLCMTGKCSFYQRCCLQESKVRCTLQGFREFSAIMMS